MTDRPTTEQHMTEKPKTEQLDELEIKLAWLESGHEQLSQTVARQQRQIDTLEKRLELLIEKLSTMTAPGADGSGNLADEIPPHY